MTTNIIKAAFGGTRRTTARNLYQYDYDALNNDISTEDEPFARVILPKGGDGSISTSKNRLIRIGD